jgi:hypothetical protein
MLEEKRLETAQWLFERQLAWIASAEVKVGVIVAIQTAMVGGLAAVFAAPMTKTPWAILFSCVFSFTAIITFVCSAQAVLPRLGGPKNSLVFFGRIAELDATSYVDKLHKASTEYLLSDLGEQIYRNAEIAQEKHLWVKRSLCWAIGGCIPWVLALIQMVLA